jgi:hypothetical protein
MTKTLLLAALLRPLTLSAQLHEDFSDRNFSAAPVPAMVPRVIRTRSTVKGKEATAL